MASGGSKKYKKIFTILETVMVVGIILGLASFIFFVMNEVMAKSRDTRRTEDINQIRNALMLFHHDYGNYVERNSGCGFEGNGNGWFNYSGDSYEKSIAECLMAGGYLPEEITDPLESRNSKPAGSRYDYMKVSDKNNVCVFARLETLPITENSTDESTCPDCDSLYGMNYFVCMDK